VYCFFLNSCLFAVYRKYFSFFFFWFVCVLSRQRQKKHTRKTTIHTAPIKTLIEQCVVFGVFVLGIVGDCWWCKNNVPSLLGRTVQKFGNLPPLPPPRKEYPPPPPGFFFHMFSLFFFFSGFFCFLCLFSSPCSFLDHVVFVFLCVSYFVLSY